jgi:hypothetical protein
MSRRFTARPQVRLALAAATDWYDEQRQGLGDPFLRAFETAIDSIMRNPFQYQIVHGKARRARLGRFPYGLIYIVSDSEIVLVSCTHDRRDPKRWQRRLR